MKKKISQKILFQQNMAINLKLLHRSGADVARHIIMMTGFMQAAVVGAGRGGGGGRGS